MSTTTKVNIINDVKSQETRLKDLKVGDTFRFKNISVGLFMVVAPDEEQAFKPPTGLSDAAAGSAATAKVEEPTSNSSSLSS